MSDGNGNSPVTHNECRALIRGTESRIAAVEALAQTVDKRLWAMVIGLAFTFIGVVIDIAMTMAKSTP